MQASLVAPLMEADDTSDSLTHMSQIDVDRSIVIENGHARSEDRCQASEVTVHLAL